MYVPLCFCCFTDILGYDDAGLKRIWWADLLNIVSLTCVADVPTSVLLSACCDRVIRSCGTRGDGVGKGADTISSSEC